MEGNLGISMRKFFNICRLQLKKSGEGYTFQNLIEWDTKPRNVKFNFRNRLASLSFDLTIVLIVFGILTLLFYR